MTVVPHEKGRKGNQSVLSLAAILSMNNTTIPRTRSHKKKHHGNNKDYEEMHMSEKQVEDFLKKYNYYSDPVLYDDNLDENRPTY